MLGELEPELAFSRVSIHELRNHEAYHFQYKAVMSPLIFMTTHSKDENDWENGWWPPVRPRPRRPRGALEGAGANNGCVAAQFWV